MDTEVARKEIGRVMEWEFARLHVGQDATEVSYEDNCSWWRNTQMARYDVMAMSTRRWRLAMK